MRFQQNDANDDIKTRLRSTKEEFLDGILTHMHLFVISSQDFSLASNVSQLFYFSKIFCTCTVHVFFLAFSSLTVWRLRW